MRESTNLMKYVFIALAGVAFLAGFLFKDGKIGRHTERKKETPLLKQLDFQEPTDPALVGYEEIEQIRVDMDNLSALTVDGGDNLYVVGNTQLQVMTGSGKIITRINMKYPAGSIALAPPDRIYLGAQDHVFVLNSEGSLLARWPEINSQALITSIAVTDSVIFVADAGNKVVWRYNSSGEILSQIGERNLKEGKLGFIIPSPYFDVAIDHDGMMWAVNSGRHSLENYTLSGELRSSWHRTSYAVDGFCGCCNPTHIATLPNGSFVTSEKGIPRVKIHAPNGDFSTVVAGPEHFGAGTLITDLAVNSKAQVIVLDSKAGVIRTFTKKDKS